MKTKFLFSLAVYLFAVNSAVASQIECLKKVEIKITKLYPKIRVDEEGNRLDRVKISLPVKCVNYSYMVPSTLDEAMIFLDKIIPLDIKIAMVKSGDSSIYGNSRYGYSVVSDIIDKLYESWKITDSLDICKEVQRRLRRNSNDATCGQSLVDQFILLYAADTESNITYDK